MKRFLRNCLLAFAGSIVWAPVVHTQTQEPAAQEELRTYSANPFFWKVEKGGATSYLFGTIHVPDDRVSEFHPHVELALDEADAVYTELAFDVNLQLEVQMAGFIQDKDKSLKDLIPADLYKELDDYLSSKGFPMTPMDRMQPWMVNMLLQTLDLIEKMSSGVPLDMLIYNNAKAAGKEVGGVETVKEQIAALSIGDLDDQIHVLRESIKLAREMDQESRDPLEELMGVYLSGSEEKVIAYTKEMIDEDDPIAMRSWRALLTDRNKVMAERSMKMMNEHPDRSYFFAFGAMHFIGKESVNEYLEKSGYKVTRLLAPEIKPGSKKAND